MKFQSNKLKCISQQTNADDWWPTEMCVHSFMQVSVWNAEVHAEQG